MAKADIKKGPWTPEEDIILVSYIQKHGPGKWRSIPANTGLSFSFHGLLDFCAVPVSLVCFA
ncbi:hypothetical protein GW17_00052105 [Ensete ventricosum]|nr:hypothetical protein GW17_00052105 [Ensete ventricosum]